MARYCDDPVGYYRRRSAELVAEFAPKTPCENCGATKNLQWDHIDPSTKEFDVMAGCHRLSSRDRILKEIAKCRVLCGHCNSLRANHKYSEDFVNQIRSATGSCRAVARQFGVLHQYVSRLRRGIDRVIPLRVS